MIDITFIQLVKKMRDSQRTYLRSRANIDLRTANELEKKVDDAIKNLDIKMAHKQQQRLF